ncbi:MAG: hypothetical protein F6K31_12805 [Symploca sp. SIO2G7]|nr:hypothetical protein [Symploca sp. SIO2G7]
MSKKSKPVGCFGQFLLGLLLMGAGTMIVLLFVDLTTLECKRVEPPTNQGECQLSSQGVLDSDVTIIPIKSLQGAKLKRSGRRRTTYRIELLTAEGTVPLTNIYSSGGASKQQQVQQIRSFIENPTQASLNLRQDNRWMGYLFGVTFGVVGVLFVFSSLITPLKRLTGRH